MLRRVRQRTRKRAEDDEADHEEDRQRQAHNQDEVVFEKFRQLASVRRQGTINMPDFEPRLALPSAFVCSGERRNHEASDCLGLPARTRARPRAGWWIVTPAWRESGSRDRHSRRNRCRREVGADLGGFRNRGRDRWHGRWWRAVRPGADRHDPTSRRERQRVRVPEG